MKNLLIASILTTASVAAAHPHITSGPALSSTSGQLVTFGISHGCAGKDTVEITVTIPESVTSIRPLPTPGFATTVTKTGSNVTSVTWSKSVFDPSGDISYYEMTMRLRVGDVPFSSLKFDTKQVCRDATGDTTVLWDDADDTAGEAAPRLTVVPAHTTGWNKVTLPVAIAEADIPTYLGGAQIVWKGTSAYSPNAAVQGLINMTPGVTALTGGLAAGDELWVKY